MSDQTQTADGRRIVGLYLPFDAAGVRVTEIAFAPCTFGHLLRWQEGRINGTMALMMELSGRTAHEIESIRRPDDGRVMTAFLEHVHEEIAKDVMDGVRRLPDGYGAGGGLAAVQPRQEATQAPSALPDEFGSSASDPFGEYGGFEAETDERPLDYIPGLDGP